MQLNDALATPCDDDLAVIEARVDGKLQTAMVLRARAGNPFRHNTMQASFGYKGIGLPQESVDVLRQMDKDGNGTLSLDELRHVAFEIHANKKQIVYMMAGLAGFLVAVFLCSWGAMALAERIVTTSGGIAGTKGTVNGDLLVEAAEAEQDVPVALAALLTTDQLRRLVEITLSNFADATKNTPCASCPETMVVQVDEMTKLSETVVKFRQNGGPSVTIVKGIITVTNIPNQAPGSQFTACGQAACSSIKVNGVNVPKLKQLATSLGYSNTGRRVPPAWWRRMARRNAKGCSIGDRVGKSLSIAKSGLPGGKKPSPAPPAVATVQAQVSADNCKGKDKAACDAMKDKACKWWVPGLLSSNSTTFCYNATVANAVGG